ncbi:PadR family transcriptional regulator [Levilactobacillus bambusae]|uniref:PadR family transcriptional regulator n=1 Tax=Levilactobacillus bambusae TaxID=2024736 RepID=A0A2V1N0S0_9LACO|nr:PadR family transcriptional regulator [Levilactobacillus bambusae]PWG00613.1 PadR family transcriptional regulator [Levilactobacillus bambusae]
MAIPISSDLLDGCVLALLKQEDYYGYALTRRVKEVLPISESTLYPVLRRLKKNQWLTTYDQPYQGRNRRYYQLTPAGNDQLRLIQQEWHQYRQAIDQLMGGEEA